ncbi:diacylglycerol kinase family protein [Micromonospora sp. NBC_01739]|uniref:diacylglycerol kinase family protein n=1 Tax=Micromonospora sp. NBC_01739 TaxID=2975985 RepID=UPI002E139B96|nr:diacylglycerol kinase family protein [Micromonospora sp. NBC_01739]
MHAVTADDHPPPADRPIAVLTNPTAGRGRHRGLLPEVLDRLAAGGRPLRVLEARTRTQAEAACREAVAEGAAALVAVGGDGTMHLALQAVAGTPVPFGAVPAGTGNDFAEATGFPADPLAAADAVTAALRQRRTRPVDLARITGPDGAHRWYGGVLAAGFDAIVNERANRMRWPRGPRRYDLAILVELARLRPRHYTLRLDGVTHETEAVLVAVGNCPSYGGGMRICPDADPNDGLLDVVVGGRYTRRTLIREKPKIYRGTHVHHPLARTYRARTVEIAAAEITTYADGERCLPLPITITATPTALHLLLP